MASDAPATLKDYEHWRRLNKERFSLHDYAYGVAFKHDLPADAILALAAVVWPAFVVDEALVFLGERYDAERLASLRSQGLPADKLEYWMNLVSVDGFFQSLPGATLSHAQSLARTLCQAWRAKLALDFPERRFHVEVVEDGDVGDVCVVFHQCEGDR